MESGLKSLLSVLTNEIKLGLENQFNQLLVNVVGFPLEMFDVHSKLALADSYGQKLLEKLKGIDANLCSSVQAIQGAAKGRTLQRVLRMATTYSVDIAGVEGNCDILMMAMKLSPVDLTTDQNELEYLLEEIQRLREKDTTEINWRDTAESWISTLQLRNVLRGECSQNVMDCLVADEKLLQALGAAQALQYAVGDTPSSLISQLSQGPGAHIRNHAYLYTKRISDELIRIDRIQSFQTRIVALIASGILAVMISIGNYIGRMANEGVSDSSLLAWLLPLSVVLAIVLCTVCGGVIHLYCQGKLLDTMKSCCFCTSSRESRTRRCNEVQRAQVHPI